VKYPRQSLPKNKLFLLFAMRALDLPLTFAQLEQIAVGADIMDYFALKEAIAAMAEDGLVRTGASLSGEAYVLTPQGTELVAQLAGEIPSSMRDYAEQYAAAHRERISRERTYHADYSKLAAGQYMACCRATENGLHLVELYLNLPTQEQAQAVCTNWTQKAPEIYALLMERLSD
jgi:hypothetical protein